MSSEDSAKRGLPAASAYFKRKAKRMLRGRFRTYASIVIEVVVLALALWLAYACLRALFTAEIGFGRATRRVNVHADPGWFWFAFWFQFGLAMAAVVGCLSSIRKKLAADAQKRTDA